MDLFKIKYFNNKLIFLSLYNEQFGFGHIKRTLTINQKVSKKNNHLRRLIMGTLTQYGTSPFDILFRNFFEQEGDFEPFNQIRVNHPVDIYEANDGLNIDIACVGLTKKDIDLTIEGDILRVEYKSIAFIFFLI